jgi:FKBP-type peptidyl-prolyl cis-trans isomerase
MKYIILTMIMGLCISFNAFAQKKVKLENRTDSVSYAIGVSMHESTLQFNHELDFEMIVAGIIAASKGESIMEVDAARDCIMNAADAENAEKGKANIAEGKKFLAENKMKDGVIETESGLQYTVGQLGEGSMPVLSDKVKVHYSGYLLDGTIFDSSIDRGEPVVFGVTQVIKGWTEALQLMPVGSKFKVYIPSDLAYGNRQMGNDIMPGSTLIFDIELLDIITE